MSGAPEVRETTGTHLSRIRASYRSRTRAAWLAAGAAASMAIILALWVVPWVPIGMTQDDMSASVWIALLLSEGTALAALLAFFTRARASVEGDVAEVWRVILGKGVRLRNRRQFKYRLAKECEVSQRDRRLPLSLILARVSAADSGSRPSRRDALEHMLHTLAPTVRSCDVMGPAGDDEIGVLTIGADAQARDAIRPRIERALADALAGWRGAGMAGSPPVVSLGVSTLGPDDDAAALLAAARRDLRTIGISKAHVA